MKAESLARVIAILISDYDDHYVLKRIGALVSNLQVKINSQQAENDKNVKDSLTKLHEMLEASYVNDLFPSERNIYTSLNLSSMFGKELYDKIIGILDGNIMTISLALQELTTLSAEATQFYNKLSTLLENLKDVGINPDYPNQGECEIYITFPNSNSQIDASQLQKDIEIIDRSFHTISEVVEDDPSSLVVKSISSSTITLTLLCSPIVLTVVAKTISFIVDLYIKILNIRETKEKIREQKISNATKIIDLLSKSEHSTIKSEVDKFRNNLLNAYYKKNDAGRKNELEKLLEISLKQIIEKYNSGFTFEANFANYDEDENEQEYKLPIGIEELKQLQEAVEEAANKTKQLQQLGFPILAIEAQVSPSEDDK